MMNLLRDFLVTKHKAWFHGALVSLGLSIGLSGCQIFPQAGDGVPLVAFDANDAFQPYSGGDGLVPGETVASIQIERYEPESVSPIAQELMDLGFEAPKIFALQSQYAGGQASFGLSLPPMTFMVFREGGWDTSALLRTVSDLPQRYAKCGIAVGDIMVVETSMPPGSTRLSRVAGGLSFNVLEVDQYHRLEPLINRLPVTRRPLFFFVGSIYSNQHDESVGGFAANTFSEFGGASLPNFGRRSVIARTGAVARRPAQSASNYQFDQTISHEIGHLLGLRHERSNSTPNIMQTITCRDCDFTAQQCATMRESRMLVR